MTDISARVRQIYETLHQIPEAGFEEVKTAAYLAGQLEKAGYAVERGVAGTGVTGLLKSNKPGPVIMVRADMDALVHTVNGTDVKIHSCGHDANAAMVLTTAEIMSAKGISAGTLKILFQPAEESLNGAASVIKAGTVEDVDVLLGIHLRPISEAGKGKATPALFHGASCVMEAVVKGKAAHGARPHLGINAIDAAAAIVNAINGIRVNPAVPATVKATRLIAGGAAANLIPDHAVMAFDIRAQTNEVMTELLEKTAKAVERGAAAVGAEAKAEVKGGVPAAEYDPGLIEISRQAIRSVLGTEGLLAPIYTPGGEDFHLYKKHKPSLKTCYIGLGADLTPGLHHPEMKFDAEALSDGVGILLAMLDGIAR